MIVVDTSAICAIALDEPDYDVFDRLIGSRRALVGGPTLVEAAFVLATQLPGHHRRFLDRFLDRPTVFVSPFTERHFRAAVDGMDRFGAGGGHPAQLNFGDCLSYGLAKAEGLPLLFKGGDFALTDVESARP